jgi:hypothetical protein
MLCGTEAEHMQHANQNLYSCDCQCLDIMLFNLLLKMHDFREQNTVYIINKIESTKVKYSMIARQPLKCTGSMNFA